MLCSKSNGRHVSSMTVGTMLDKSFSLLELIEKQKMMT